MKRILWLAVALVVVLVGAAVLWLASSLDGIVEDAIEQVGSELLGTRVSVSGVSIDLAAGSGSIRGLEIANPRGEGLDFGPGPAVALEEVSLELDLASLAAAPLVARRVRVARPEVNAELANARLNVEVLRQRAAGASAEDAEPEGATTAEGEPVRLRIDRFEFAQGAIRLDTGQEGEEVRTLVLPSFQLSGLGGAGGASPGALGKAILAELLGRVAGAVAREQARGAAGDWIDEKLGEDRPGAADAAKKVIDGLLGGGDD